MANHVIKEASRCLGCKNPSCIKGCPISTNIPEMIAKVKENNINEAGHMLFENNPLSVICSLVCNHDAQCEGHCVLGKKGNPVQVSAIEHYVSSTYLDRMPSTKTASNRQKVAVIGSGPAGITISLELAHLGYDVTIFESKEKIGGVLRYGIPAFRLSKDILDKYEKILLSANIKIRPNTAIGISIDIDDIFRDGYVSIFVGTGVWKPKKLGIRGETLGNVHFGIDYLANPEVYHLGKTVAIIGAGNTAVDVARTALRNGATNVTLYSRSDNIAASNEEVEYAKLDGAEFVCNHQIREITELGPVFETFGLKEADSIIIAASQGPKSKLVRTTRNLQASEKGLLITDDHGQTTTPGVFAAGDVVHGARTVVEAVAKSKEVARKMHEYMSQLP